MQANGNGLEVGSARNVSSLQLAACSWFCGLAVALALMLCVTALRTQPPQPDFAEQLRGMRGMSTLNVDREELTSGDITQLANAAAEQRRQALRKQWNGNNTKLHLVATTHHQVRTGL